MEEILPDLDIDGIIEKLEGHGWRRIIDHEEMRDECSSTFVEILPTGEGAQFSARVMPSLFSVLEPSSLPALSRAYEIKDVPMVHVICTRELEALTVSETDLFGSPSTNEGVPDWGAYALVLRRPLPLSVLGDTLACMKKGTNIEATPYYFQESLQEGLVDFTDPVDGKHWSLQNDPPNPDDRVLSNCGFQLVLVSHVPLGFITKNTTYLDNNPVMMIYREAGGVTRVELSELFPGVEDIPTEKPKVVSCTNKQLYALLSSEAVPMETRTYSALANVYSFTASTVLQHCNPITFSEAAQKWHIRVPQTVMVDDYQIAIAVYLIGICYTIKENAAAQITKRLNAARASMGDNGIPLFRVAEFIERSHFVNGCDGAYVPTVLASCVALVGPRESTPRARKDQLLPSVNVQETYNLSNFITALYTQLRLVSEGLQSQTIRFGVAGLEQFEMVRELAYPKIQDQATNLRRVAKDLIDHPYTGCCNPIPAQYYVGNQADICLYGVLVYERSLTPEEKENFQKFRRDKIEATVSTTNKWLIQMLVDATPAMDELATKSYLSRLTLEIAELHLRRLPLEKQTKVTELFLKSKEGSPLGDHLRKQAAQASLDRVNRALIDKIILYRDELTRKLNRRMEFETNATRKGNLRVAIAEMKEEHDQLIDLCRDSVYKLELEVAPMDAMDNQAHISTVSGKLKELMAKHLREDGGAEAE